jgi:T5SS/PEP-CTERM-associated repeat protein
MVTGTGSKWTSDNLYVGYGGTGALTVQAGAEVSTLGASVGYWRRSRGTATITGTGSKWTNSGDLSIGPWGYYEGSYGTLNIENQGTLRVGGSLRLGRGANLKLDGGTLDALTIYNTPGGRADFLAGTLRFGTFEGNLTNAGATVRSRDGVFGMRVNGNYTQGADAKLLIEIAGLPDSFLFDLFDVLTVTGAANLAGTLALDFSAYVPPEPATYKFLNAPTITGTFDSFEVIGLDPSLVSFNIPAGEFTVVPEPATLALLLAAGVCLLPYARRKRN